MWRSPLSASGELSGRAGSGLVGGRREIASWAMSDVRALTVTDQLQAYVVDHGSWPVDQVLADLKAATEALGPPAGMQVNPDQGQLLTFLTRLVGARRAVEVGTFTGYSSLCIARGMPADGQLICCDLRPD